MALKKTVTTIHGLEAVDAYHRVESIKFQGKDVIKFHVRSYKDADTPTSFADVDFGCGFDLSGKNPFAQAYDFVKSRQEFSDAEDC